MPLTVTRFGKPLFTVLKPAPIGSDESIDLGAKENKSVKQCAWDISCKNEAVFQRGKDWLCKEHFS